MGHEAEDANSCVSFQERERLLRSKRHRGKGLKLPKVSERWPVVACGGPRWLGIRRTDGGGAGCEPSAGGPRQSHSPLCVADGDDPVLAVSQSYVPDGTGPGLSFFTVNVGALLYFGLRRHSPHI